MTTNNTNGTYYEGLNDTYTPTAEDLAAYNNLDYTRTWNAGYGTRETAEATRIKSGQWIVRLYSPMALNMCETMGRFETKVEACAQVDRIADQREKK